ncbi:MAG: hypothetical protein GXP03_06210 [Alphaproteobacteria bacterium]|nr:hypothetical protein [Alphaproteobacteria bacterium]
MGEGLFHQFARQAQAIRVAAGLGPGFEQCSVGLGVNDHDAVFRQQIKAAAFHFSDVIVTQQPDAGAVRHSGRKRKRIRRFDRGFRGAATTAAGLGAGFSGFHNDLLHSENEGYGTHRLRSLPAGLSEG